MMERIFKIYLPSTAMTFSATILCACILNLMEGYGALSNWWILQLFGYILTIEVVDMLLENVEFKSYLGYFVTETVIAYGLLLAFGYFGRWFSFTVGRLLPVTVIFLLIYAGIHRYFYQMAKNDADEINRYCSDRT